MDIKINKQLADPVCGMSVAPDSPHQYLYEGDQYYFCSDHCLHKFSANPDNFLHRDIEKSGTDDCPDGSCIIGSTYYTCPMHPEIRQEGPGSCPKESLINSQNRIPSEH